MIGHLFREEPGGDGATVQRAVSKNILALRPNTSRPNTSRASWAIWSTRD